MKVNFFGKILNKKFKGFTLAEVLITLGIVGVVAAMTIPNLMTNVKAHRLRSKFLKSYSTIQQAFKQMEYDDVSLDPASYPSSRDTLFYLTYKKYLQVAIDCGSYYSPNKQAPCYDFRDRSISYRNLNDTADISYSIFDAGQIVLNDGTLILFNSDTLGWMVSVDLNGFNGKPNRMGYDLFTFMFMDGELRLMGDYKTKYNDLDKYCNLNSRDAFNGIACAVKAKDNSDYFKWVVKNVK